MPALNVKPEGTRERFLDHLSRRGSMASAAKATGVSVQTVWRWRNADPVFAARCDEAKQHALEILEDSMYMYGLGEEFGGVGKGSFLHSIAFLKGNDPSGKYRDSTSIDVRHSGVIGTVDLSRFDPIQLQALLSTAAQHYLSADANALVSAPSGAQDTEALPRS